MVEIAILGKVSELLIAPIGRQLGYLFKFTGNVETLENEQKKLRDLKNGVEKEVKVAENNADDILDNVKTWLKCVDLVDDKAQSIVEEKARFPKGCFNNWCLNLKSRYVLSRRANKITSAINDLQQEGKFPKVSSPAPPTPYVGPTSSTSFESRELIIRKIIEKLRDENINIIGLCGMGGIGKTTMVNDVFKRVKEENMFDDYAMTVVSQRAEMINVERDIAKMLGLKFEENNPQILRASRLNQRLDGKKVLIIVDDVWEQFDLQSLGITLQDGQSKCKIVFTSRIQGLWMGFRSRRHELSLDPLTEDESWKLFTEKIGDYPNDDPEFVSVARQIANECAGLPLALVVLGSALLRKKEHAWNDTLLKLRKISKTEGKVHESIRLSYDYLDDEEAKSLFLLCSLFKEDSFIDVESLVHMGWGLRLFKGIDRVEEARDRVFALVEDLQSRCLLSIESTGYNHSRWIKIHDVVRDVSKSIARTEKGSLVIENGLTLEASVEESFVERCTWISVISEENKELPPILQFPRLKLLLCNNTNEQAFTIPDSYFEGMVKLQVVDISYFLKLQYRVLKLPSSLQYLTSLHTLCLRNFTLESYSTIKYLQNLEILHIEDPFIEELPNEIGQLSKLRLLDMSDCDSLAKAPPGIISGLSSLEELYLGKLNIDWGEDETEEGRIAVRREFESLSNLRIFHIVIPDPGFLPRTPVFRDLKKYKIHIGHYQYIENYSQNFERILSINDVDLDKDFNFLVYNAEGLLLTGMTTKRLVYELVQRASQIIRCLEIRNTETPEYLADATDSTKTPCLVSKMESLTLDSLNNLQQIINGPLVDGNIGKLKKLVVLKCRRLKNIFLLSNALDILHLEKLHVSDCEKMEEVFFWKGREKDSTSKLRFPKLVDLKIGGESLVCFCKGAKEIEFDQLKSLSLTDIESIISISDENCANLFFLSKVVFPKLVYMELSKLKNMKEIWCGQIQSGSFNNLYELNIKKCDSVEYVFNPYMARYLVHLQNLYIDNCPNLKEIVNGPLMIGSLLKLNFIKVDSCNQLRNIFQLSTAVDTVNLTRLCIYNCGSMEEVISWKGRPQDSTNNPLFPNLCYLNISNASSLVCFCIGAMQIEFQQLADLYLDDIPAIECLVSISNENSLKSIFPHKVVFPKLVTMELSKLKKMKEIWCGQIQSGSFNNLSKLSIKKCDSVEYVFTPDMARYLVHLKNLSIENCTNLKEIVNGPLMIGSLLKLNYIRMVSCNQLRNIFQLSTAVDTVNFEDLTKLQIIKCESMEEVISWEGRPQDSTNNLLFPKLYGLYIINASSLVCFCIGATQIEFQLLVHLYLQDIPAVECLVSISNENSLKSFFPHKVFFPKPTRMELYELKNMKDIWCGQLQAGSFNNLSILCIWECGSLEYVFSPCTAIYLMHLRKLDIFECKNLKEVVSAKKEVDGIEEYTRSIFPKLEEVKLYKLLSLERFYHVANEIEFPKLFYIGVVDCPAFKSFSPGFVHTPILNHVNLDYDIYGIEKNEVTMWKGNLNSTIRHLHEDQQQRQRQRQNKSGDEEESGDEKDIKEES